MCHTNWLFDHLGVSSPRRGSGCYGGLCLCALHHMERYIWFDYIHTYGGISTNILV